MPNLQPHPAVGGSYVGIPFVDGGRDRAGCDCWGLVRMVLAEQAGIEVPSYGEISAANLIGIARAMQQAALGEPWRKVESPRELDVVVMRKRSDIDRQSYHVGIIWKGRLLHTVSAADSHTVPLDDPSVRSRIIGIYRHQDIA